MNTLQAIKLIDVENRMVEIFKKDTDFMDSSLIVLEVTYKFPTGNFFQEVVRPREWDIIGVAKTNDDIKEYVDGIRKNKKIYR